MRYFIGFLVTIGLIILIIILLVSGGGKKGPAAKTLSLDNYAYSDTTTVEYLVDNPIQSNQVHNTVKIDISKAAITATVYQGYDQQVLRTESFPNNDQAFAIFMHALHLAQFEKGNSDPKLSDERGYCPAGQRYIYKATDGDAQLMRYWRTSCGQGTYQGSIGTVSYLFTKQIPPKELGPLLKDINISL